MTSEHEIEQILNQFVVADNHRESDYFAAIRKLVAGRAPASERLSRSAEINRAHLHRQDLPTRTQARRPDLNP